MLTCGTLALLVQLVSESFEGCLALVCAVQSSEVLEAFPFIQFSLQIHVAFVTKEPIEFLLIFSAC